MKRRTKAWIIGIAIMPLYFVWFPCYRVKEWVIEFIDFAENALEEKGW